ILLWERLIAKMIFNTNFEEQILNLFDEFHFPKEFFSFIWIILSILTLILGVTIGVLPFVVLFPSDFLWQDTDQTINTLFLGGLRAAAQSI
ncbi:unnamed protein product, partial [Sphagnum jensenii]